VNLVVEERKSYPETPMCLSETLFMVRNGALCCPWKHFFMIVYLYWKCCMYFLYYICIESTI